MIFYKYYNEDCESVQWLAIEPQEDFSGLVYMDDFNETAPNYSTIERYGIIKSFYDSFIKDILK